MTDPRETRITSERERDESVSERADRNFGELVQELRVAQTGVQILFGFLLALAFYDTFPAHATPHRQVLTLALLSAAGAASCFMTPVVAHRLHFREGAKERLVWVTHRVALAGMTLFAVAMDLALWLVLARLWPMTAATVVSVVAIPVVLGLWIGWPRLAMRG